MKRILWWCRPAAAVALMGLAGCGEKVVTEYVTPECSQAHPYGVCPEGQTCFNGSCVAEASLCSPSNPQGLCPTDRTCFAGGCVLANELCSATNPAGACPTGNVCLEGACVATASLCSSSNPTGKCKAGEVCQDGLCAPPATDPCTVHVYTEQPTIVARTEITSSASATVTLEGVAAGARLTVAGVAFTAATSKETPDQFAVGANDAATATNLANAINSHTETADQVTATAAGNVVTLTAKAPGAAGNGIAVSGSPSSAVKTSSAVLTGGKGTGKAVITVDGLQFKDLNGNGTLEPYEDWRLKEICRAKDLAARMTVPQKIGLMREGGSAGNASEDASVTSQARSAIVNDNVRQWLYRFSAANSGARLAAYNNSLQELAEALPLGIPMVFTADPAHRLTQSTSATTGRVSLSSSYFSDWPSPMGLGAAQDVRLTRKYGETVRKEFMALGIRWQLGPMGDTGTEPRWDRWQDTFGEGLGTTFHTRAAVEGYQGSSTGDIRNGIAATVKHFPGAGPNEDGMDSHSHPGRYNVFPGNNFEYHLSPFQAAFDVGVAAIMPCYSVFKDQYQWEPYSVAAGFSYGIITRLAKERMGFTGMVTGDWGNLSKQYGSIGSLSNADKAALWLKAGSHQFGSDSQANFQTAYDMGLITEADIDGAAWKILEMSFKLGIFENPYVNDNPAYVESIVKGQETSMDGFNAQKRALVMLRNQGSVLPLSGDRSQCDSDGDGTVEVYYNGINDGLSGSDYLSKWLDDYDYSSPAQGTTRAVQSVSSLKDADVAVIRITARKGVYMGLDAGVPLSFDGPFTGTGNDSGYSAALADRNKVINAFRVRDGYTKADGTVVPPENPKLKIVLVMHAWRPSIVKPFIHGLKTLDEIPDQPGSYPMVSDEANINPTIVTQTQEGAHAGVEAFIVDFGAYDRAILDFLFNKNVPPGVDRHGLARIPFEFPSSDAEVEAQFEDMPADTKNPTYIMGSGTSMPVPN